MAVQAAEAVVTTRGSSRMPLFLGWLAFIVLFALHPRSGLGLSSQQTWHDQEEFFKALNDILTAGHSDMLDRGIVGPGYVALGRLIHEITRLPADASLALLALISFLACGLLVVTIVDRAARDLPAGTRAALIAAAILAIFSSVWPLLADVPWTHTAETALLLGLMLLLMAPPSGWRSVLIGALIVLAYQTRAYEGDIVLIALAAVVIVWGIKAIRTRTGNIPSTAHTIVQLLVGAVLMDAAIWALTGVALPFVQYGADSDISQLAWSLLPSKVMQLFVDTCFSTVCTGAPTHATNVISFLDGLDMLDQPLALQLPAMIAAGLVAVVMLLASPAARRALLRPEILVAILTAGGAILAYTAAAPAGSPHLKFSFYRDYLAPMLMLVAAMACLLAVAGPAARRWGITSFFVLTLALMIARPFAGSLFPQTTLASVDYTASCTESTCGFAVAARHLDGTPASVSAMTIYGKQCGDRLTRGIANLSDITYNPRICSDISLIPAVTGYAMTPNPQRFIHQPKLPAQGQR